MPGKGLRGIVLPLTLITVGVVLLLRQMGYLQGDIWRYWRYWPVLLIVWGVGMIFASRRG